MKPRALTSFLLIIGMVVSAIPAAAFDYKPTRRIAWGGQFGLKHAEFTVTREYVNAASEKSDERWQAGTSGGGYLQVATYMMYDSGPKGRQNMGLVADLAIGGGAAGFLGHLHGGADILISVIRIQALAGGAWYPTKLLYTWENEPYELNLSGLSLVLTFGIDVPLKSFDNGTLGLELGAGVQTILGPGKGFRVPATIGLNWRPR